MTVTARPPVAAARTRRGLFGLLAATGVSIFGTRMSFLAVPWFVLVTTGSAGQTGLVAFAEMTPYVVVEALGGPYVDRVGKWRLSVATDLVATVAVGVVPLLYAVHHLSFVLLCVLVAVAGAVRGAGDSARYVMLPDVAERAGTPLERGAGLLDGVERLAGMLGAPIAGVLIAVTSAPTVLAVDAATFLVSAAVVAGVVPRTTGDHRPPVTGDEDASRDGRYLTLLREGFSYLRGDRLLLGIAVMVLVTNLIDQASGSVLTPVWARQVAGSPVVLGFVAGAFGVGAVAGNVLLTWLAPRLPRHQTYAWCFLVAGAPRLLAMGLLSSVSPVLIVCFIGGLGAGGINPILGAVEYERIPEQLRARVLGALGALAWAGIPVGALAGGVAVEHFGLRPSLLTAAVIYLAATLAPFVFPAWRGMDREERATTVPRR